MKQLRRLGKVVCGALITGYLLVCALLFGVQRQLTFPAPEALLSINDGSERIAVPNGTFFLWKQAPGTGPVVVHFHGNGEQVSNLSWLGEALQRSGASFVAVEYPGYPGAGGHVSESAIVDTAEAALTHLTTVLKIDRSRIVLAGQSIGSGVAVTMAARGWGVRLVLISPYTSLPAVAQNAFPWLPVNLLMLDRFDSESKAPRIKVPTLVVHGDLDSVIPIAMGRTLCAAIPGAQFLEVTGGHHHDLLDRDAIQSLLIAFVKAK